VLSFLSERDVDRVAAAGRAAAEVARSDEVWRPFFGRRFAPMASDRTAVSGKGATALGSSDAAALEAPWAALGLGSRGLRESAEARFPWPLPLKAAQAEAFRRGAALRAPEPQGGLALPEDAIVGHGWRDALRRTVEAQAMAEVACEASREAWEDAESEMRRAPVYKMAMPALPPMLLEPALAGGPDSLPELLELEDPPDAAVEEDEFFPGSSPGKKKGPSVSTLAAATKCVAMMRMHADTPVCRLLAPWRGSGGRTRGADTVAIDIGWLERGRAEAQAWRRPSGGGKKKTKTDGRRQWIRVDPAL
jgi:hypothetical protein